MRASRAGGARWPARSSRSTRCWPRDPEPEQREGAVPRLQLVAERRGRGEAVRQLAAIGLVHGPRRNHRVGRRMHGVPPERIGAGEAGSDAPGCLPDLLARHQTVRLLPELHLAERAVVPAVADDSVLRRCEAREHGRLRGAGDRGKGWAERADAARAARELLDARRRLANQVRRERDDVDEADAGSHAPMVRNREPRARGCARAGPRSEERGQCGWLRRSSEMDHLAEGASRNRASTNCALRKMAMAAYSWLTSTDHASLPSRNSRLRMPSSAA